MNTCKTCRYISWRREEGCRTCLCGEGTKHVYPTDAACEQYEPHTREFFQRVVHADRRIAAMAEQCAHYRELAMRATGNMQALRMSGTQWRSKVEDGVVHLVDLIDEIDRQAEALCAQRREVQSVIDALDDPQAKEVLELRYLGGMNWNDIALRMHYEMAQIHRIHRRALTLAQQEIEERAKRLEKRPEKTEQQFTAYGLTP